MPGRLEGKQAFDTAAAAGIGRACAFASLAEGARALSIAIAETLLAGGRPQ